ncbi:UNVERIFIED_CONTAM: hypothetical protein FKN15_021706 [Acipenser sinensis]
MDRNALAELLQALESRRDAEERRREERYTALIERPIAKSVIDCAILWDIMLVWILPPTDELKYCDISFIKTPNQWDPIV